ncbi:hypothetical protein SAMN05216226_10313 [Halovenus aranensis]|jgi:hypothetical protein|uniref:Uncharacterized protein n=1 Tax=Halovenus aranensis TaxID=890420 RepID=A0A1G8TDL2_9EURY|nr:hypothetical protein [Halovenus aranensis]SDJ39702.1 hypothetical protein SAMN05216226_10313 [Halovenus aranensis]
MMTRPRPHHATHLPDDGHADAGPETEARRRAAEEAAELVAATLESSRR